MRFNSIPEKFPAVDPQDHITRALKPEHFKPGLVVGDLSNSAITPVVAPNDALEKRIIRPFSPPGNRFDAPYIPEDAQRHIEEIFGEQAASVHQTSDLVIGKSLNGQKKIKFISTNLNNTNSITLVDSRRFFSLQGLCNLVRGCLDMLYDRAQAIRIYNEYFQDNTYITRLLGKDKWYDLHLSERNITPKMRLTGIEEFWLIPLMNDIDGSRIYLHWYPPKELTPMDKYLEHCHPSAGRSWVLPIKEIDGTGGILNQNLYARVTNRNTHSKTSLFVVDINSGKTHSNIRRTSLNVHLTQASLQYVLPGTAYEFNETYSGVPAGCAAPIYHRVSGEPNLNTYTLFRFFPPRIPKLYDRAVASSEINCIPRNHSANKSLGDIQLMLDQLQAKIEAS